MNIYTFYEPEPILADHENEQLIELWKKNWASHGWTPVVLTIKQSCLHPNWPKLKEAFSRLPSVNPGQYDQYCYYRWVAMVVVGGGWMADYDVFNYGFEPCNPTADLVMASSFPSIVPCLVGGTPSGFQKASDMLSVAKCRPDDLINNRPHISDMIIAQRDFGSDECQYVKQDIVRTYDDQDESWKTSPAVHYSCSSMNRNKLMPKWKHIPNLRQ